MTLPAGITTFALNYGRPFNFKGDSFGKRLEITPSHDIVWAATGDPLKAILITDAVSVGELGTVALPHTDQAGFVDLNGDAITDWWYTVKAYTLDAAGRTVGAVVTRRIQVTSDVDDVDLELLPADATVGPVGSVPLPAILSVNGATGVVVITAAGIGAYELPETGLIAHNLNTRAPGSTFPHSRGWSGRGLSSSFIRRDGDRAWWGGTRATFPGAVAHRSARSLLRRGRS